MGILEGLRIIGARRDKRWHGEIDPWTLADWSNALCGEAGEYANVIKKIRRIDLGTETDGRKEDREDLVYKAGLELADVVQYALLNAEVLGIDLSAAISVKFDIVSVREGFPERLRPDGTFSD